MMQSAVSDHISTRNAILAEALKETLAELRLIEAGDLIGYIRSNQWANIADLVQSSTELFFVEGTIAFACLAEFEVGWGKPTSIALDMEFQAPNVSAFFKLTLGPSESLIDIGHVWFAATPPDVDAGTAIFAQAIADARLPLSVSRRDRHQKR